MSGITEKLYPPIINGTLPAFYGIETDNGTVGEITVPFSMNRAVNTSDISGFSLKLKTVQSNSLITTLRATHESTTEENNRYVVFSYDNINESKIKVGQFLKAQLAYIDQSGNIGYYSTVGILKYTTKPKVYIKGYELDTANIRSFQPSYTGVYEPTEDKTERPYSYNFSLYDDNDQLIETSDWLIHNTSLNNVASESLSLDQTTDTYSFNTDIAINNEYKIIYSVRTINNLEISTEPCLCAEPQVGPPPFQVELKAENNFEEGYIKTFFVLKDGETLSQLDPVSIELCRAEKTDNFSSWKVLKREYFQNYDYVIKHWNFKDFTIEQGITYKYCFRQYNKNNIQSDRSFSNEVIADFEDMFLWDGEKQIKIRFNPQVSSFKINRLEQKTDTIGSKYPFIFRNGIVEYKEFPISGLISYLMDDNELFLNHQEDLNIVLSQYSRRQSNPVDQLNDNIRKDWESAETLNSLGYNMRAERKFKLKLLEWLGNGQIKLFKSPAEGNYFVRLLNISLSPENRLSRMLHTFSCTAYEVEEFNYNNLIQLGFLDPNHNLTTFVAEKTVYLRDFIDINKISIDYGLKQVIQINDCPVFEYINIMKSQNSQNKPFYIRFGPTEKMKREIEETSFSLFTKNKELSNIYFCLNDHLSLLEPEDDTLEKKVNKIKDIIGDTQITYRYYTTNEHIGKLYNINDIYLKTYVKTFVGETNNPIITFNYAEPIISSKNNGVTEEKTLKFFTIDIQPKNIVEVYYNNNKYYKEKEYINEIAISSFDKTSIYKAYTSSDNTTFSWVYVKNDGNLIGGLSDDFNPQVILTNGITNETEVYNISDMPVHVNLNEQFYSEINVNKFAYITYSYQNRIVKYGEE